MSWFRRKPRIKEPVRLTPHRRSPISEKVLEEAKKNGPSKQDKSTAK